MSPSFVRASLTAACVLMAAPAVAQPPSQAAAVDVRQLGPQAGERVPDFELRGQDGAPRTLTSVLGPSGGLLVFFRSADW